MCNQFIVELSSRGQLFVMIGSSIALVLVVPLIKYEKGIYVLFVCDLSSVLLLATPIKRILDQCCGGR